MKNHTMTRRTHNTLFMLSSVDGKISTGDIDKRDADKDFPTIKGVREGLGQYYALERRTDLHSLNTGRVMAKLGMNKKKKNATKVPVSFVIVDNKPHLNKTGLDNLLKKCKTLYVVTTNTTHPALILKKENLRIVQYNKKIDFPDLFSQLRKRYNVKRITIQSGGTLNATLLREGLIDEISLVVAPALIGGANTPTIVDGSSLRSDNDLNKIRALKLQRCRKLNNSYLHLTYRVLN